MVCWGCIVKTKVCPCCKEELPLSEFYKCKKRTDGFQTYCKKCHNIKNRASLKKKKKKKRKLIPFDVLGGFKITIQNYARRGEFKYNILPIGGKIFATNNKQEFMDYLEAI